MLAGIDLHKKMPKEEYKKLLPPLELKIGELQRLARTLNIPVMIVFEGMDAAGKGTMLNKLLLSIDPRGFTVHQTRPPTEEELYRPYLWRFWCQTPAKGRIAIFDRSWYRKVLSERVDKITGNAEWQLAYEEINTFERQLADDGTVIIKLFLAISHKEQKKRFEKLASDKCTEWKVTAEDWRHLDQYDAYVKAVDEMLAKTDTECAPWTLIEAHDERFAAIKIFTAVSEALEARIAVEEKKASTSAKAKQPVSESKKKRTKSLAQLSSSMLDNSALDQHLTKEKYEDEIKKLQKRIWELEHEAYMRRIPVAILYEGWDAAGKGGNIKRIVQGMDPRGYEVVPVGAPNDLERSHHYLWRFWCKHPKGGHFTIFDRTWYGRVLVERVEGFCREDEWKRAYQEINEMESQWASFGTVIFKFWLQIDSEEQLRRFKARQASSDKSWKITDEDWRNREKWPLYKEAVDEMLLRTSTPHAPWTIVEANCKYYARLKTLKTIIARLEKAFKSRKK